MSILITGCKGQLGTEIARQLTGMSRYYDLIETDKNKLDITDCKEVFEFVRALRPAAIINCAAYTHVDQCESEEANAFLVNALGAGHLSAAAFDIGAKIFQISTDYVFDGEGKCPKKECDPVGPVNCYGRSKEYGERLVRESNPRHFIIRTAWLYGAGTNFVRTMLMLSKQKTELDVVCDQFGTPTSTSELARCITGLLDTEAYGTYHGTCNGQCSWYDFAVKIFELCNIPLRVNPITSELLNRPARRPRFTVLNNFMLEISGMNTFRNWEEALEEYINGVGMI